MKSAIRLKCPSCSHPIGSNDINIFNLVAKCSNCACIFPFKARLFEPYSVSIKPEKIPPSISVHEQDKEILLTYHWRTGYYFLILIAGILWNVSTILWFAITLANEAYLMAMLGSLYAVGGISLLYVGIAGLLNYTVIKVDEFQLSVKHQPIFWLNTPKLRRDHIVQLYCTLHLNRNSNYIRDSYQLHAILKDGKHVCLLKGIQHANQAQFLEYKIERFLKIKDRYVRGEYIP